MNNEAVAQITGEPVRLKLSSPLRSHKGDQHELELRPILARAFSTHGTPFREYSTGPRENRESRFEFVWPAVFGFASMATGFSVVELEGISAADMIPLGYKVVELITQSPNG